MTTSLRPEPNINDLPQSSSDDEVEGQPSPPTVEVRTSAASKRSQPHRSGAAGDGHTPFVSVHDKRRDKRTYGRSRPADLGNIENHVRSERLASRQSSNGSYGSRNGQPTKGARTIKRTEKATTVTSTTSPRFRHPPAASVKARREFRAPNMSSQDSIKGESAIASSQAAATDQRADRTTMRSKAVFKSSADSQEVADTILGEDHSAMPRPTAACAVELSASSGTSSPSARLSPIAVNSSNTSASLAQNTLESLSDDEPENLCPVCNAPVSAAQLSALRASHTLRRHSLVSQQTDFCRAHREADARAEWHTRGYPDIDWGSLPERLEDYRAPMAALMQDPRRSWFRARLEEKLAARRQRSGRARDTLLQQFGREDGGDSGGDDVGYYGARGAAACMHFLASAFAPSLQLLRTRDPLVAACGGVAAYQQLVLLPELCCLLMADDMCRDAAGTRRSSRWKKARGSIPDEAELEKVREIMRESAELGRLLCEEENEEILSSEEEDEVAGG